MLYLNISVTTIMIRKHDTESKSGLKKFTYPASNEMVRIGKANECALHTMNELRI